MKIIIPTIALLLITFNGNAQEKSRRERRGNAQSFSYDYKDAIETYTDVKKLTIDGQRSLAKAYCKMDNFTQAEAAYSRLVANTSGVIPDDYYHYAMALKSLSKFEESNKMMDKFVALKPSDLRGQSYTANKSNLTALMQDEGKYRIAHLKFNTDAQDFGPSYYKKSIVFSSTRKVSKAVKRNYLWNNKPFLNIYVSKLDDNQMEEPSIFDKSLDSKLHDGPVSFSNNFNTIAFTRNHLRDKSDDRIVELQIFFSNYEDGKWTKPEACNLNNALYSVGHPNLSEDGKTMYFASDMLGGYGGVDIYKSTKEYSGLWGTPQNLGSKVNTEGDEMFPFMITKDSILVFASNGHYGMGGLDIFMCRKNKMHQDSVYNAGSPLNTPYDDFAAIANAETSKGYFSSNRPSGSGFADIYSVDFLKGLKTNIRINGIAKDINNKPLPSTFISLTNDKTNKLDTFTTKLDGAYIFEVDADNNYTIIGRKANYFNGENTANTFGKELDVFADVVLLSKEDTAKQIAVVKKLDVGGDIAKSIMMNPIYFDLDKYSIRPDAEVELNKIVMIMNENKTMVVELGAYTDCRASKEYNQILSNKRAKSSVSYIRKRISRPERITGKGYGETKFVNGCACEGVEVSQCTEEQFQLDRRTEFIKKKTKINKLIADE